MDRKRFWWPGAGGDRGYSNPAAPPPPPPPPAAAPVILDTDIVSGPMGNDGKTTGDENGLGTYLSIFGYNFGSTLANIQVTIGGQAVANLRVLENAKNMTNNTYWTPTIQHLRVQVGALGALTNGTAYPIKVLVSGVASNADHTFTPNPGKFYWIDPVNGSDSNPGTMSQPYKSPQLGGAGTITGGAITQANAVPGTTFIYRAGTYSSIGMDTYHVKLFRITGLAPTGALNTGYVHITSYPGEVAYLHKTSGNGTFYGNQTSAAEETTTYGTVGWAKYISISNLKIDELAACQDGPISIGSKADSWRIFHNELGPWPANVFGKAGGIAGDGTGVIGRFNYIHDIVSPTNENHGIYMDASQNVDSWFSVNCDFSHNYILNMNGGSGCQSYANGGTGSVNSGIVFHHNAIVNCLKYGVNFADATLSGAAYDNLIIGCFNSVRFNTNDSFDGGPVAFSILNNTCYNPSTAFVQNDWNFSLSGSYIDIRSNIFIMGSANVPFFNENGGDSVGAFQFKTNLYWDPQGRTTSGLSQDATGIFADPKVVTSWTDFHLQSTSPAINAGIVGAHLTVTTDLDNNPRPALGNANPSIGAYELTSGLPAWLAGASTFQWVQLPSPSTSPAPTNSAFGSSGSRHDVIDAWGGAALRQNGAWYILHGGGHGDYWGDEIYGLSLVAASPTWQLLKDNCPAASLNVPFSITAITQAAQAVVTVNSTFATNPFASAVTVEFVAAPGGMTQITSGTSASVVSTGGSSGAWTVTININSSSYSAYTSGGTLGAVTGWNYDSPQSVVAMHTYQALHFDDTDDKLIRTWGQGYNGQSGFQRFMAAWPFQGSSWDAPAAHPNIPLISAAAGNPPACVHDPATGNIYIWHASNRGYWARSTNSWTTVTTSDSLQRAGTACAFDTKRQVIWCIGGSNAAANTVYKWTVSSGVSASVAVTDPTGICTFANLPSACYDPKNDAIWIVIGDGALYKFDPNALTISVVTMAGTAPLANASYSPSNSTGSNGRLQFVPALNGIVFTPAWAAPTFVTRTS